MADRSYSSRPLFGSRSFQASQSLTGPASSRPFLNMLNPMGRAYQGYSQVLEENEEEDEQGEHDLEAGPSRSPASGGTGTPDGRRRVSWEHAGTSHTHAPLRPNIQSEDATYDQDSSDDEVPQDLMVETSTAKSKRPSKAAATSSSSPGRQRHQPLRTSTSSRRHGPAVLPPPAVAAGEPSSAPLSVPPRPSEIDVDETPARVPSTQERQSRPMGTLDAYDRAMWNWVNVYNLDAFLQEVYYYYEGKGIYSIALTRGLNLLTVGFVIGFSTFLLGCVDYSRIRPEGITRLSDVVVRRCVARFSGFTFLFFLLFTAFYAWQIASFVMSIIRLVDMYNFYTHLLKIPDADIQTISWPEVVRRIGLIREENPLTALSSNPSPSTTAKLDAHDIANRIMRQENYLIALFNKDLLDLRVPLPAQFVTPESGKGRTLTRALEWNLRFCLMDYLFDAHGKVRKVFLKSKNRTALIEGLRRRFIFMGILNAIFAPFIVLYLLMYSFFRYFEEYHKNPASIGTRQYTPFAQWKFREFNELPHLFTRRLDESYPTASMYIGQFPNAKMATVMRFVAFIAGSFAAVLVLASVVDPDLFLSFEITPHRTVLFYITVFTSILAVARGMIPEDNNVFDPEILMEEVIRYTHYMPDEWKEQLHSKQTHAEFGELFAMKIMIFLTEIASVALTPFVLWFSLPNCAPVIIDFFRDFTVHVDGRGYVCSFAEFDFHRHGNVKFGAPSKANDARMMSKEGKMEKSFLNFKAANPDWNPTDPSGSLYLSRMADFNATRSPTGIRRRLRQGYGLDSTVPGVVLTQPQQQPVDLSERAQEYDRALLQSQHVARRRHQASGSGGVGGGGSTITRSNIFQSTIGGMAMAETAVLGDSQGSVSLSPPGAATTTATATRAGVPPRQQPAPLAAEDITPDGGVGSALGGSYVDGAELRRSKPKLYTQQEDGDYDDLEDEPEGVLGLLRQVYGNTKGQGPARVI